MDINSEDSGRATSPSGGPRFTLRELLAFVVVVAVLLAWYVDTREDARNVAAIMQRRSYVRAVLGRAFLHEAVREQPLLGEYKMHINPAFGRGAGGPRAGLGLGSGQIMVESNWGIMSTERRSDWPIEDLQQAALTALVEAVQDADVLTSTETSISPHGAVLAGEEGWIIWEVTKVEKVKSDPKSVRHMLRIGLTCRARFRFDEPFEKTPNLYAFGDKPEQALLSGDVADRLAGAAFIRPTSDPAQTQVVFDAIERESDPAVMSRLFLSLEGVGPASAYAAGPEVLFELRAMMEQEEPVAPLAARTILRSDRLREVLADERDDWTPQELAHLRTASIAILAGDDRQYDYIAVEELCAQMTPDDTEAVDAILDAFEKGGQHRWHLSRLSNALGTDELAVYAAERLLSMIAENDRPEVWFNAAQVVAAHPLLVLADGEVVYKSVRNLGSVTQRRMALVQGHSADYQRELEELGDDAFEFLVPLLSVEVCENVPAIRPVACQMLASLGDQRAVPILVQAVEDEYQQGNLDPTSLPYYAVSLIRAINQLTGEDIGGLGTRLDVDGSDVKYADWAAIRQTLAAKFGTSGEATGTASPGAVTQ